MESSRLLPFVPSFLVQWYRGNPDRLHQSTTLQGALVCLDASGFTALTGRLESSGEDGPEILTRILNQFFSTIIDLADEYAGDVLKFSGDGLWLYVPDARDVVPLVEAAQASLSELNRSFAPLHASPIRLHAGAEEGSIELVSLGDAERRLELEPVGPIVSVVYDCCDRAESGSLVVGSELAQRQRGGPCLAVSEAVAPGIAPQTDRPAALLSRYIPRALVGRLAEGAGPTRFDSEYREVAVMFCNCRWDHQYFATHRQVILDRFIEIARSVHTQGGSLARIDPFKDGHKLLILFGAPVAQGGDHWRALQCARQLTALHGDEFGVRVGIARGRAFCGSVGSSRRMEYTVMGTAANLAARLMTKADWGSIVFDDSLRRMLPQAVASIPCHVEVKGFSLPITVHRFDGIDEIQSIDNSVAESEVFLHASFRRVLDLWREAVARQCGGSFLVHGAPGSGKSCLVRTCAEAVAGAPTIRLDARQAVFFGPGYLARRLIDQLATTTPEIGPGGLGCWASKQSGSELLPLLLGIIDGVPDNNVWTQDLSPQLRLARAGELYVELIRRLLRVPVFVLIDDLDRADAFSRHLIRALAGTGACQQLTILITTSEPQAAGIDEGVDTAIRMELCVPLESEWRNYLSTRFDDSRREVEFIDRLILQSGGLPAVVFGVLGERSATGALSLNPITSKRELSRSATALSIPGSVRELQVERFDSLPEKLRSFLKLCAVHPAGFSTGLIASLAIEIGFDTVADLLFDSCERRILVRDEHRDSYGFANGSLRDVIYGCIPRATLNAWHCQSAEWLEQHGAGSVSLLAYHFANTDMTVKGFSYSLEAAQSALATYALTDAAGHFESCRRFLSTDSQGLITPSHRLEFYQSYAKFLVLEGRPADAYGIFRSWRRQAKHTSNRSASLSAALAAAELLWQQSRYGRCSRVLKAALAAIEPGKLSDLVARGMTLLAEVARRTARFSEAESWARRALAESNDPQALADAHNRLGLALWGQGRLPEAVVCLQQSLSEGQGAHSMYNRARIANNLAIVQWQMGGLVQAEPLMREAIDIFKRQGDRRNEAYARGNLAALIREFGKHADARRMLLEADIIFDRLGDKHAHFYTVGNLGDIDLVSGDLASAEHRFKEALAFAESVDDGELRAECQVRLGEAAFFRGDPRRAEQLLDSSVTLAESIESGEFALRGRVGLARVRIGLKEMAQLPQLIEQIRKDAQESRTIVMDQEGLFLLGEYHRLDGNIADARDCFEQVFAYARGQRLFELSLKCAVRIVELAGPSCVLAGQYLADLCRQYEADNGSDSWSRLVNSAYFSFFRPILQAVSDIAYPITADPQR